MCQLVALIKPTFESNLVQNHSKFKVNSLPVLVPDDWFPFKCIILYKALLYQSIWVQCSTFPLYFSFSPLSINSSPFTPVKLPDKPMENSILHMPNKNYPIPPDFHSPPIKFFQKRFPFPYHDERHATVWGVNNKFCADEAKSIGSEGKGTHPEGEVQVVLYHLIIDIPIKEFAISNR